MTPKPLTTEKKIQPQSNYKCSQHPVNLATQKYPGKHTVKCHTTVVLCNFHH